MRLATTLFDGGRDDDGLLILADLKDTVQVSSSQGFAVTESSRVTLE